MFVFGLVKEGKVLRKNVGSDSQKPHTLTHSHTHSLSLSPCVVFFLHLVKTYENLYVVVLVTPLKALVTHC